MSDSIKELNENNAAMQKDADTIMQRCDAERRLPTDDENKELDTLTNSIEANAKQIDYLVRKNKFSSVSSYKPAPVDAPTALQRDRREDPDLRQKALKGWFLSRGDSKYRKQEHVNAMSKVGYDPTCNDISITRDYAEMQRGTNTLIVGTSNLGGYASAINPLQKMDLALLYYGNVLAGCTMDACDNSSSFPYPTNDDTANKALVVAESGTLAKLDTSFNQITVTPQKFHSGNIVASYELIFDMRGMDFEAWVVDRIDERNLRGYNYTAINASTVGILGNASSTVTAASTTTVTYAELKTLEHSVDVAYRDEGCAFVMHDTMARNIESILDNNNRPMITPSFQGGIAGSISARATLLGYPVVLSNQMPTAAAAHQAIVFGNLKKYVWRFNRTQQLQRLVEVYQSAGAVGFSSISWGGGNYVSASTSALASLTLHA